MSDSSTDCRTDTGVTVGIVDSIITLCRLLRNRELTDAPIQEALRDLASDEDFANLLNALRKDTEPTAKSMKIARRKIREIEHLNSFVFGDQSWQVIMEMIAEIEGR